MLSEIPTPLFIFEMANNHMGDIEHGVRIIREFKEVTRGLDFRFSIKLQHRHDSFFHPDFVTRTDYKYIKRFTETKLSKDQFRRLHDEIKNAGFITMCTPWDEPSVDLMEELDFDIIKVASCSFTDWPLHERIVKTRRPVIASTAAAELLNIDRVVSFYAHRNKALAILHCVGEYPCRREHLELNQISFFRRRYPGVTIGYSTHEAPENCDSIRIAVAQGAEVFEKHVAVATDKYKPNAYSATPEQARRWLEAAVDAYHMCGVKDRRKEVFEKEVIDIQPLKRGVFARRPIAKGEKIKEQDIFYAMPNADGQLLSHDMSKYTEYFAQRDIAKNAPLMREGLRINEVRGKVNEIVERLKAMLKQSRVALPPYVDIDISCHYGIERFDENGAILVKVVNRAYSKMLLVMFPGQSYPRHRHLEKEETFNLLYGDLSVEIDGKQQAMTKGDLLSVDRNVPHSFTTKGGAIVEEIATTYRVGDSVYDDRSINDNPSRKIQLTFWPEWLKE